VTPDAPKRSSEPNFDFWRQGATDFFGWRFAGNGVNARRPYSYPRRLFRADGTLVPIVELDENAAGMIAAIEVDEDCRTTRVCMWDKNQALEKALKYLGLYERESTPHSENLELQVVLVGKP